MQKNDVSFKRDEYKKSQPIWKKLDDVCEGQLAIKDGGVDYLPKPNPNDLSAQNQARYSHYVARAVFYNATGRTLQFLVGAAFRQTPQLENPASLNYISDDIDGAGVGVFQQAQSTLASVLKRGRHGLLADYPRGQGQTTVAQVQSGNIRATAVSIEATDVINWRYEKHGAVYKLSLLVISEVSEEITPDGFGLASIPQIRVLRLDGGMYTQELWRKDGDSKDWVIFEPPWVIKSGNGQPWTEIPFTFVGSENNDATVDQSPLYDMAELNIAHYRNSADYEDSAFFVGQAQPWMSGLSEEWRDHLQETGIYVGSRNPILLPEGGAYGIAQAQPNTLAKEAMDQKERQMTALGAKLVQPGGAAKTATEAKGEQQANYSVLSLAAENVSSAYTKVLGWMALFMNAPGEASMELNTDFIEHSLEPQMLTALISAYQSGQLPESDLWGQLKKYGVIDPEKNDDDIRAELELQDDGLGLDDEPDVAIAEDELDANI